LLKNLRLYIACGISLVNVDQQKNLLPQNKTGNKCVIVILWYGCENIFALKKQ